MILAAMIAYYVFAIGLIGGVAYFTARQGVRRTREQVDRMIAQMQASLDDIPLLEPYVREPLPDEDPSPEAELRLVIRRHPETELLRTIIRLVEEVQRADQALGGVGLRPHWAFEPAELVVYLVPIRWDGTTRRRLEQVAEEMNRNFERAREDAIRQDDDLIRERTQALDPPLPPEVVRDVAVEVGTVVAR